MADRIGEKTTRARAAVRLAWLLGLAAVFLAPAIGTGYWSEDLYQSVIPRGGRVIRHTTWLGEVADHVKITLTVGRFFPLTPALMTTVHTVFRQAWAYKAYIVATGVLDVLLFSALAGKLAGRRGYGVFAACLTIGLIQYRVAVDQSLAFSGQVQWLIAGTFLTLLTLQQHLETRRWGWLAASVAGSLACDLLYEVAYLLALMPLLLILRAPDTWRRRAWTALPFCLAVGSCAFESFLVRWLFPSQEYWHKTSFDPNAVTLALVHQATAALPLSYLLFDPLKIFPGPGRGDVLAWLLDARVALVALPAFGLSFLCLRKPGTGEGQADGPAPAAATRPGIGWGWVACLGLILAVFPAVMVAISPYHRDKIGPGVGWSPVLIQVYGVGLLLSGGLWTLVDAAAAGGSRARWKCLAASAVVAGLVGVTYRANLDVVRCFNAPAGSEHYREVVAQAGGSHDRERHLLEAALDAGLMDAVPENAVVQYSRDYIFWHDMRFGRFFYAAHAGKAFTLLPPWAGGAFSTPEGYRLREALLGPEAGYVVLAKGIRGPQAPEDQPPAGGLRLFVRHPRLGRPGVVAGFRVTSRGRTVAGGQQLSGIRSGPGWAVYSLEGLAEPVAPESLQVAFDPPTPAPDARAIAGRPSRAAR